MSSANRACISFFAAFIFYSPCAHADDWPQWGGPKRDLIWREAGVTDKLPEGRQPRLWSQPISAGYSGPAVADDRVFVTDRVANEDQEKSLERIQAFDANDGHPLWKHEYKAPYSISYPLGPRAAPTVDDDRVYVLGAVGHLHCLKADSGEVIWQKQLPADFGTKLPTWGMAAAPLVVGDQLIVLVGGEKNALVVSFDKRTGRELWRQLDDPALGYSPPVVLEYAGQRQLIVWHASAVSALDPASGAILWQYPHQVREALAIMTPRKVGERGLFVSSFYQGPIMLDLGADGKTPTLKWDNAGHNELTNQSIHTIMPTPIVGPDWLAGVSSYGQLRCVDAATGKMLWETRQPTGEGRWWNAFLVPNAPDGEPIGKKVFLTNEQGELIIASISREGYQELGRSKLIEPTQPIQRRMTAWSHPAYAMQSIFARNDKELIRVNLAK